MSRSPTSRRSRRKSQAPPTQQLGDSLRSLATAIIAKPKRRKLTSLQKLQRQARKSALSFLKRKGLSPKGKSLSAQRRAIRKYKPVIERKEVAYKLPKDFPKRALRDLKASGYKVERGKLILPKGLYTRQGKVYTKAVGKRRGGRIDTIKLGVDFEQQIRDAFASLKKGDWIGFSIYGNNSYNIYQSADGMLADLMGKYVGVDFAKATALTIFRVKDAGGYIRDADERRAKGERERSRRRRAMRKGMRIRRRNKG